MNDIIRQRRWSKEELVARGFRYHRRRKQVVMARELPAKEAPLTIATPWETLVAQAGYMICYEPGDVVWPALEDYISWPVEPAIFRETYAEWDEPDWEPGKTEAHLMSLGCKPYYKFSGVWAKKLTKETVVQSIESPEPVTVPPGAWVSIGVEGEPYSVTDRTFYNRYEEMETTPSLIRRVIAFLRRRKP
jgi:hypothetical protein